MSPKVYTCLFTTSLVTVILLVPSVPPVLAGTPTVISFEQGEGFGIPGSTISGLTTNGGLATWSVNNLNGFTIDSGPGDGFNFAEDIAPLTGTQYGIANGLGGEIAQVTLELSEPMALDSFRYANRGGFAPRLEVEYFDDSGQSIGINAYMAPYDPTDSHTNMGSYLTTGMFRCTETTGGLTGCGVGLDNLHNPKFHQISPTEPFEGVGLSKIVINSFHNPERMGGALNVGDGHGSFYLEDVTFSNATTSFNPNNYLRISFEPEEGFPDLGGRPTRSFAWGPFNLRSGGTLLSAKAKILFPEVNVLTTGAGLEGIIEHFSIADNLGQISRVAIDHGPGCGIEDGQAGYCIPSSEPDPVHGGQMILVNSSGDRNALDEAFTLEIDLDDNAQLSPVSFWYSYRGNGSMQSVDVEYFDLNNQSLGIESWDGSQVDGVALGMNAKYLPKFDKIVIGEGSKAPLPTVKGVPLSKMIINSTHNIPSNNCGSEFSPAPCHASFAMDDLLFECTTGNCPDYPDALDSTAMLYGDYNKDEVVDDKDLDLLAAKVRDCRDGGLCIFGHSMPPYFASMDVDGINVDDDENPYPDEADFEFFIAGFTTGSKSDDRYLRTLHGDFNLDRVVNFLDFVLLSNNFGSGDESNPALWSQGNGNTDLVTNFVDFVLLSNNFNMTAGAASSNVPEPASLALVAIGVLAVAKRWRNAKSPS